jgi:hypothetical protein
VTNGGIDGGVHVDQEEASSGQEDWDVPLQQQIVARRRGRPKIRIKQSRQGSLRRATGTKKGKKIPMKTLQRMKRSKSPAMRKKANFAINARKWRKTGGRRRK